MPSSWRADGTLSDGSFDVQLTGSNVKLESEVIGGLVKVPFRQSHYYIDIAGSTASFQASGINSNEDGTGTGINVSVPAVLGNGVRIRFPFYGRSFGVRFKRDSGTGDFSVAIDGVSYGLVVGKHTYLSNELASATDGEANVLIADDLPDCTHYADIMIANGATTNTIMFYGYLAERSAGYSEKPRSGAIGSTVAMTTSDVAVPLGATSDAVRKVQKIIYTNTTAGALTVTIKNNTVVMWSKSIPANDSLEFDFGASGAAISSLITHTTSGTGINATVIGGY